MEFSCVFLLNLFWSNLLQKFQVCLGVTPCPFARYKTVTGLHNTQFFTFAQFPLIILKTKSKGKLSAGMKCVTYLRELLAGKQTQSLLLPNWASSPDVRGYQSLVPWLMLLVAGFCHRTAGFHPKSICVEFVVDKVALDRVLLEELHVLPVSMIPVVLHTHSYS